MGYREVTGDLFELDLPALGHGCNPAGVMGAGIAVQFRKRWPDMYAAYKSLCEREKLPGGYVMSYMTAQPDHPVRAPFMIYNMITHGIGVGTNLDAIGTAVRSSLEHAEWWGIRHIGVPRIGTGIGGLDWADVQPVLEKAGNDSPVELVVATLPESPRSDSN